MTKAVFLIPILFLILSENLLFAKENPLRHSYKSNSNKKLLHEEKPKAIESNKSHTPQNRDQLERCQIICPILLPPPQNSNGGPNRPVVPTTAKPTTSRPSTTTEESTESEETTEDEDTDSDTEAPPSSSSHSKNITNKFKPMKRKFTKTFRVVTFQKLKNRSGHGDKKNTYHRLMSNREKHILLKQLNLGNRHGKKGYKCREINSLLCQVVCDVIYAEEYPSVAQPITTYEEEDPDDGDNYEEGEDTPIEMTIKPIAPQNTVIGGIRPFGNVDFMGMDDFGPNGELAGDSSAIYEDKSARRKAERTKLRKKAVVAEKNTK